MEKIVEIAVIKVKITKCSHEKYWYSDKVGQVFSVVDTSVRDYYVIGERGISVCILKVDAEVVK
jgi:hypothetical protein